MKDYKFMIIKVKLNYPICLSTMQEHIWHKYITGLAKKGKLTIQNQSSDFDKIDSYFKIIKNVDNKKVEKDSKTFIETNVYYFVRCNYEDRKLKSYEIMYTKYPEQKKGAIIWLRKE